MDLMSPGRHASQLVPYAEGAAREPWSEQSSVKLAGRSRMCESRYRTRPLVTHDRNDDAGEMRFARFLPQCGAIGNGGPKPRADRGMIGASLPRDGREAESEARDIAPEDRDGGGRAGERGPRRRTRDSERPARFRCCMTFQQGDFEHLTRSSEYLRKRRVSPAPPRLPSGSSRHPTLSGSSRWPKRGTASASPNRLKQVMRQIFDRGNGVSDPGIAT